MTNSFEFWVKREKKMKDYGKFIISPLPSGFGHTVGNSLRRVLLGAMPGAAVTQVKIEGAEHIFATMKGVKEDVIDIIMNMKQIRVLYEKDKPTKAKIEKVGSGPVLASDIIAPPGVEIVNKDLVLANLADKKTKFKAEITIERGEGFSLAEEHKIGKMKVIPVDAIFSPVIKANYTVKPVRVGKQINLDELTVEIWSDGTQTPENLLKGAAKVLVGTFNQVANPRNGKPKEGKEEKIKNEPDLLIDELDLPLRLVNALKRAGFKSVSDFSGRNRKDIATAKNIGEKSLVQLEKILKDKGIVLGE